MNTTEKKLIASRIRRMRETMERLATRDVEIDRSVIIAELNFMESMIISILRNLETGS